MNRIIKFRTWSGKEMIMLNLFQVEHYKEDFVLRDQSESGGWIDDTLTEPYWPIMQFTGLLDKNGKEIYEGDVFILKKDIPIYRVVKYDTYNCNYIATNPDYENIPVGKWILETYNEFEVIGNIYENPELISTDHA